MHKLSNHCKALLERQVEEEGAAEGLSGPEILQTEAMYKMSMRIQVFSMVLSDKTRYIDIYIY